MTILSDTSTSTTSPSDFAALGLGEPILRAIQDMGYTTPTPIQAQSIPHVLLGRDLVGLAQTGTGKTASFTLPMIEHLSKGRARSRMPRSLVLTPTRELAAQVAENFDLYGKYHPLSKALLVGGESMSEQIKVMERGADVLIATPGRLLDLFERGQILLTDIRILVIDEADRMLDMGFIPDIEKIISKIPARRQTLLFSATMPPEIESLAKRFLNMPHRVSVTPPASTATTIDHRMFMMDRVEDKKYALRFLLEREDVKNAFVFCNRKRDVDALGKWLKEKGFSAAALHGDMVQAKRTQTLQDFKDGKIVLLVCSDVAARGLDVVGVSHVFNIDVPFNPDDYVHRIGRTGRAGQTGKAWTLITPDDEKLIDAVNKRIGAPVPVEIYESNGKGSHKKTAPAKTADSHLSPKHTPKSKAAARSSQARPPIAEQAEELSQFTDDNLPAFLRR
jgi:superfamily II DNA/RNA helicase